MKQEDLVGVWTSQGEDVVGKDGGVISTMTRSGQIMYAGDGRMGVISTPAQRKKVPESGSRMDLDAVSAADRAESIIGCVAYAGRFSVKDDHVLHHVEVALNPNLIGETRARRVVLNGDDLWLHSAPDAEGRMLRIRWRRAGR